MIGLGCQMGAGRLVPSPLTFDQQRNKILKVVSLGTLRDDVESRLKEAGIEGQFGINQAVYYCDIWTQENGDRWRIDVALLFDEKGELYKTRPATAETRVIYDLDGRDNYRGTVDIPLPIPQGGRRAADRSRSCRERLKMSIRV